MTNRTLTSIDIIVPDVADATRLLVDAYGAQAHVTEPEFAELGLGGLTIMLSRTAMVPMSPAQGVILHLEVDDPQAAAEHAVAHGAQILQPLTATDWGTRSVLLTGPASTVIDLYSATTGPAA